MIAKATTVEPEKANDKPAEQAGTDFQRDLCDFSSNWENGLSVHMARKHVTIEQIDGLGASENEDKKFDDTSHYWKTWILRKQSRKKKNKRQQSQERNVLDPTMYIFRLGAKTDVQ